MFDENTVFTDVYLSRRYPGCLLSRGDVEPWDFLSGGYYGKHGYCRVFKLSKAADESIDDYIEYLVRCWSNFDDDVYCALMQRFVCTHLVCTFDKSNLWYSPEGNYWFTDKFELYLRDEENHLNFLSRVELTDDDMDKLKKLMPNGIDVEKYDREQFEKIMEENDEDEEDDEDVCQKGGLI